MTLNRRDYTLARLMAPDPVFIEPLTLAERKERLDGSLPMNAMERLREIIEQDSGTIEYHLQLGRDDMEIPYIKGSFKATLRLICQRCLNPFDLHLCSDINIGLAMNEKEIDRLPGKYEPMLLTGDQVSLLTLIEDEILLNVPMAPVHNSDSCPSTGISEEYKPDKENPFAVLKDLVVKNAKIDTGEK